MSAAGAENALRVLTQDIPPSRRDEVIERVCRVLMEEHEKQGPPPPDWLRTLIGPEG